MLEGIFPIGLLRLVLLGGLAFSHKGIGQVVGGVLAKFLIIGCFTEMNIIYAL
jgi:hypothetical protein